MYKSIIEEIFAEAPEIKEYLIKNTDKLCAGDYISIITGAPISIWRKAELIKNLSCESGGEYTAAYNFFAEILDKTKNSANVIYTANCFFFDENRNDFDCFEIGPYSSFDKAIEGIKADIKFQNEESDTEFENRTEWYKISRYILNENKDFRIDINYIYANGDVMFFDLISKPFDNGKTNPFFTNIFNSALPNLKLETPFKPGDALKIDCRPFAHEIEVVISENSNPKDCCSLQGLYVDLNGKIKCGAVLHNSVFPYEFYTPRISPLYRAKVINGPLQSKALENERIRISKGS